VGDLNEIHPPAYSETERRVLQTFNYQGLPLPTAALQHLQENRVGTVLTRHLKHESVFNKNVCHWLVAETNAAGNAPPTGTVLPFYSTVGDHTMTILIP
jgi:hypothetical protein